MPSAEYLSADLFDLDISYLHMDLNVKVRSVFFLPSSFNPMSRSTLRGCSFHGTDTSFSILKTCSRRSAVTRGHNLIGIGLKVHSAASHRRDIPFMAELTAVVFDQMRATFTTPSSSILRVLGSVVGVIPPMIIKSPPARSKT